jgi:hypothetical protein
MSLQEQAIDGLKAAPSRSRFFAVHGSKVAVAIRLNNGIVVGGVEVGVDGLTLLALIDALSTGGDPQAAVAAMKESERTTLSLRAEPEQPRRKRS